MIGKQPSKGLESSTVYAGSGVTHLPKSQQRQIAEQVHTELKKHPHTMILYSVDELVASMEQGRAACILNTEGTLLAFAQVWLYETEQDERYFEDAEDFHGKTVYEVGTWLSFAPGGFGRAVLEACTRMWFDSHPDAAIICVIAKENERAATIITRNGGKQIGIKLTFRVSDKKGNNAMMKIFTISVD